MSEHIRIVEINGVKIEVDLRTAKKIENYKVGDNVKILIKQYSDYKSHVGVIIGFDEFQSLPTIIICYIDASYTDTQIKFAYLNSATKDIEICPLGGIERNLDVDSAVQYMDKKILNLEREIIDIKAKKDFFLAKYNMHFNKEETK